MNRFASFTKPLMWLTALLLAAFVAGCGGGSGDATPASSAKAITAYSLAWTTGTPGTAAGTISEAAKTIAVTVPTGTSKVGMIATFTTTGASVKIGATSQDSGTTPNDFSTPKAYIVTAADGSTATYTVTVTVVTAAGPAAVDLLSIKTNNFVVLAKDQITDANLSSITGNIGLSPAAGSFIYVACSEMQGAASKIHASDANYAVTGFATCSVPTSTLVGPAVADLATAYTAASAPATPAATDAAHLNVGAGTLNAGNLNGGNYVPGTYTWNTDVNVTGDITLTGGANDVWIFQMSGNLAVDSCASCSSAADTAAIQVTLSGGAVPSNVFWQVGGGTGATLGTYSTFNGNILSATQVIMQTGAVLHGRALATTTAVLDANVVGP